MMIPLLAVGLGGSLVCNLFLFVVVRRQAVRIDGLERLVLQMVEKDVNAPAV